MLLRAGIRQDNQGRRRSGRAAASTASMASPLGLIVCGPGGCHHDSISKLTSRIAPRRPRDPPLARPVALDKCAVSRLLGANGRKATRISRSSVGPPRPRSKLGKVKPAGVHRKRIDERNRGGGQTSIALMVSGIHRRCCNEILRAKTI